MANMADHFDALETRSPQQREQALFAALPAQVRQAQQHSAALGRILAGVQASAVTSRTALAQLPVTRKSELLGLQQASRPADPFGGFAAVLRGPRMRASPMWPAATTGAWAGRFTPLAFGRAIWCTTHLATT